ncbi:MAG: oxygen-binding di-iron domain-containing protein [Polyangiales bacterium]
MTITNAQSGTNVVEIADKIFRIATPVPPTAMPGGFSFNQILVVDEEPLLFHTGLRRMFPLVREAVAHVLGDAAKLRHLAFSHVEADECGSLNEWLAAAPNAQPVCGTVAAMVSIGDLADRPPRGLADGEELVIGKKRLRWLDAPHVPHAWECGFMFEVTTRTLLCGDLFTQAGHENPAITESEILGPSEAMRSAMDYSSHSTKIRPILEKIARTEPTTLAVMHGSAYRGDGAKHLRALADALAK